MGFYCRYNVIPLGIQCRKTRNRRQFVVDIDIMGELNFNLTKVLFILLANAALSARNRGVSFTGDLLQSFPNREIPRCTLI